jgi:PAS domain S-box-containing protein
VNVDEFSHQIDSIREVINTPRSAGKTASKWLGVLEVILEELDVAIEELREQNEELRLNQRLIGMETEHYRDLFELAPDGYLETNSFGVIREANRTVVDWLRVDHSALRGKPLSVFIDPNDRRAFRRLLQDVVAGDIQEAIELKIHPRDRVPFDAELIVGPGRDPSGESVVLRWSIRNITERNRRLKHEQAVNATLQARINESAANLQRLLDSKDDSLAREAEARREADTAKQRLDVLATASEALSASTDEISPLDVLLSVVVPTIADWGVVALVGEDGDLVESTAAHCDETRHQRMRSMLMSGRCHPRSMLSCATQVLETGMPQYVVKGEPFPATCRRPDALDWYEIHEPMQLSVMCVPLRSRGDILGVLEIGRSNGRGPFSTDDLALALELTGRSSLVLDNARLFERSKAAAIARDQFLAVAAHELRTPITIFRGYAQILSRLITGEHVFDNARALRMAHEIQKQADHLAVVVDQLLDVSRSESGRLSIQPTMLNVSDLVANQIDLIRHTTGRNDLNTDIEPEILIPVDSVRCEQVISNLLENAVKFSFNGGGISVSLKRADEGKVRITVADHGMGIDPEHRSQIFERFYLGHDRPEIRGLGLGLYISREIMRQHGGDLWAEFPDVGTKFIAEFPSTDHKSN